MSSIQVTLTEGNLRKVEQLSKRTGRTPDDVVNEAVEKYVASGQTAAEPAGDDNPRLQVLGMYKGQIWMSDDFNAPLSDEELKDWGL